MSRPLPVRLEIAGQPYRLLGVLASGTLSLNLLYGPEQPGKAPQQVVKISRMRGLAGSLLWPFLFYLSWREYRIYQRLDGLPGIPPLGPRLGLTAFAHQFVPGKTLEHHCRDEPLAADFFEQLRMLIESIHRRRVFYADLDKRDNIVVDEHGHPQLFDFQASFSFREPRGPWSRLTACLFNRLIREDYYHLYKHKRRLQPERLTEPERQLGRRSNFSSFWQRYLMKPWKQLRRRRLGGSSKHKEPQDDSPPGTDKTCTSESGS